LIQPGGIYARLCETQRIDLIQDEAFAVDGASPYAP
jgi:hypothetical protein